jgi:hypothetical protein
LLVVSCINIFTGLGGTSDYRHPFLLSIRNNCILQLWQRTTNNNQRTLPIIEHGRKLFIEEWMKAVEGDDEPPNKDDAIEEFDYYLDD